VKRFTELLKEMGLSDRVAQTMSREVVLKAKKKLRPKGLRTALVTIEDSYRHNGRIRLFIKPGSKATPDSILSRFLQGKKGYPNFETFEIHEAFGLVSSTKIFHCEVKQKPIRSTKVRTSEEEIRYVASQMSKEQREDLIKKLQKSLIVE